MRHRQSRLKGRCLVRDRNGTDEPQKLTAEPQMQLLKQSAKPEGTGRCTDPQWV